jgi:large subunit ribosomal protein L47
MLMTMEHTHLEEWRWWASPERLDKVKDSMQNIETVVRERNKAYYELETGVDGERPGQVHTNVLGMKGYRKYHEHVIPFYMNKKWREKNPKPVGGRDMFNFLKLYRERIYNDKRKARVRDRNHLIRLIRRFPDLDRNMLQEKYPNVAVRNLEKKDLFRGHYVPRVD